MKYLPISDTMSVSLAAIDLVEANGEMGSRIHTDIGIFDCVYPYATLMGILEGQEEKGDNEALLQSIDKKIGNIGVFAG